MKKIGIIGYGRFGKVLASILGVENELYIYDCKDIKSTYNVVGLSDVLKCEIVFISVPISDFSTTIKSLSEFNMYNTTIIDVCSVKKYPVKVMQTLLPSEVGIIASHPMFGPDSFTPFHDLKIVIHPVRDIHSQFQIIKQVFERQSITIIEMDPDTHDKNAAMSQGVTHFIGRVLEESGITSTKINTLGFNELLKVIEQTCHDSWNLFKDLQRYNPYTQVMVESLEKSIEIVHGKIVDNK